MKLSSGERTVISPKKIAMPNAIGLVTIFRFTPGGGSWPI
jgi:hypothetical protein